MEHTDIKNELGRRDFIRSAALAGTGLGASALLGACYDEEGQPLASSSQDLVTGRKWVRLDSVDPSTGVLISLDGFSDTPDSVFSADIEMDGYAVLPSGAIVPLNTTVDHEDANGLTLKSLGGNSYRLESEGVPHPAGAPYEIHFVERTIPGTEVVILTGYLEDPSTAKRVNFTVTHDPIPIIITVAIAASLVAVAVAAAAALACAGSGGVKSYTYSVNKSGITGSVTCNHNQGSGG